MDFAKHTRNRTLKCCITQRSIFESHWVHIPRAACNAWWLRGGAVLNAVLSAESWGLPCARTHEVTDEALEEQISAILEGKDLTSTSLREEGHGGTWRDRMDTWDLTSHESRPASGQRRDRKEAKFKSGSCRGTILSENFHKISRKNLPCLILSHFVSVKVLAGWTISEKW